MDSRGCLKLALNAERTNLLQRQSERFDVEVLFGDASQCPVQFVNRVDGGAVANGVRVDGEVAGLWAEERPVGDGECGSVLSDPAGCVSPEFSGCFWRFGAEVVDDHGEVGAGQRLSAGVSVNGECVLHLLELCFEPGSPGFVGGSRPEIVVDVFDAGLDVMDVSAKLPEFQPRLVQGLIGLGQLASVKQPADASGLAVEYRLGAGEVGSCKFDVFQAELAFQIHRVERLDGPLVFGGGDAGCAELSDQAFRASQSDGQFRAGHDPRFVTDIMATGFGFDGRWWLVGDGRGIDPGPGDGFGDDVDSRLFTVEDDERLVGGPTSGEGDVDASGVGGGVEV